MGYECSLCSEFQRGSLLDTAGHVAAIVLTAVPAVDDAVSYVVVEVAAVRVARNGTAFRG